eukprot:jgi/Psemu1/304930/fgenesh1_kg.175_\
MHLSQIKNVPANPVILASGTNVPAERAWSVDNDNLVFISVRRFQGQKGTDSQVKALAVLLVETEEIDREFYRFRNVTGTRQTPNRENGGSICCIGRN